MKIGDKLYFFTKSYNYFSVEIHKLEKIYKNGDIKLEANPREPIEPINEMIAKKELFLDKKALLKEINKSLKFYE